MNFCFTDTEWGDFGAIEDFPLTLLGGGVAQLVRAAES